MGVKNEEPKKPRKSWIYYYCIVLIVTMLLNTLLFPSIRERSIREVAYSEFLNMVDQGRVDMVELQEDQIQFLAKNEDGKTAAYKTGLWPDDALSERLYVIV